MFGHLIPRRKFTKTCKALQSIKEDEGYLKRRLQQLKDENSVDERDPLHKLIRSEKLDELAEDLPRKEFEQRFKAQLEASKLGNHVGKELRETALSKPWTGEEYFTDTSLRMLLDSVKEAKSVSHKSLENLAFKSTTDTVNNMRGLGTKNSRIRDRLEAAQDSIINYQNEKDDQKIETDEASEFRALYAEKFTPVGSFEKLRSLADVRIEESMKKGEFRSTSQLRGQKLAMVSPKPYVDRTEHHLNDILARQKMSPPWIDKQGSVNVEISRLRSNFAKSYHQELISQLNARGVFKRNDKVHDTKYMNEIELFAFRKWTSSYNAIAQSKINELNNSLRSYNLQAPLSTQKFYLLVDKELSRVLNETDVSEIYKEELRLRNTQMKESLTLPKTLELGWLKALKFW
ncbi:LAFA_0G20714g1_1 [Lachancea sp. 'fantastica']|nr:LAFA_0G20714g1_1 [Lachancea sp. 'fantastica']